MGALMTTAFIIAAFVLGFIAGIVFCGEEE